MEVTEKKVIVSVPGEQGPLHSTESAVTIIRKTHDVPPAATSILVNKHHRYRSRSRSRSHQTESKDHHTHSHTHSHHSGEEDDQSHHHHHHHHHHHKSVSSKSYAYTSVADHSSPYSMLRSAAPDLLNLEDIHSDVSDAPREGKQGEVCVAKNADESLASDKTQDSQEDIQALASMESLAPFKLKWTYGRCPDVEVKNLTGVYKNHIAYAASNIVIIYDFVGNEQQCLQGHKNAVTCLAMDTKNRFFASVDAGHKSLIIIWDILQGKALKFFPEPHNDKGCVTVTFTGIDYILASIGHEDPGKQTVCLWDFDPTHQRKLPIVVAELPGSASLLRELSFCPNNPDFFTATGDKSIIFCTWIRPTDNSNKEDHGSIFCYRPKSRKNLMSKYRKFCQSLWIKDGQWLATSTMSGFVCIWATPTVLGLEDPPEVKKNIRELTRFYRLSDDGLTYFTLYKDYVVVGDERGIIWFYDQDMKVLRWTKNFFVKPINCIHFNLTEDMPAFKRHLRQKFDRMSGNYLKRENNSRVRDYSMGGAKDRELSMATLNRPTMPCVDFVYSVTGGDIYYYHFNQAKVDKLVHGASGKFVTCDVCPGSNNVVFCTRRGEAHVYDFVTHKLIFADTIFTGTHRVSTMKFHPTGYFISFGLVDGHLTFRRTFSWKTLIPPMNITTNPILRIIFSVDGLLLSYFTNHKTVVLIRYLPKSKSWVNLGRCRTHHLDICDIQFLHDPVTKKNRLFSLGLDRYLVEYDIANCNPGDPKGLRVLKIMRLEETCQPTAMVFNGPPEFGDDCVTFSNTLNKLRLFHYKDGMVRETVSGPIFGRDHAINRMIAYPAQMGANRFKNFIIFVRGNKLGIIDTPIDGNPHKYMAVFTHPGPIVDISVVPEKQQLFTVGHKDTAALQWEACMRSVEATVIMGGSGVAPFYHVLRRNWGDVCSDIVKEIDLIFFFLNLKRVDTQTDIFNITRTIRLSEIPAVCRACGFFPSEYEVDLMIDEARRIKIKDQHYTDDHSTEFSFEDFVKLFSNHYYKISESEIEDAFRYLGFDENKDIDICRSDFVRLLTSEGEELKSCDLPIYLEALYMDEPFKVFSNVNVECRIRQTSISVSTGSPARGSADQEPRPTTAGGVFGEGEKDILGGEGSGSSSSSSTHTGDPDEEDSLAEMLGSDEDEGTEGEEEADEDDDDDDGNNPTDGDHHE